MNHLHSFQRFNPETLPGFIPNAAFDASDAFDDAISQEAEVTCLLGIEGTLGTSLGMAELD